MKAKVIVIAALALSFLPVWKSGGKSGLSFWQFIANHMTIFGYQNAPQYIPQEDYLHTFLGGKSGT